jgi:hypothetical protein
MVQTPVFMSISDHRVPMTSLVRAALRIANSEAAAAPHLGHGVPRQIPRSCCTAARRGALPDAGRACLRRPSNGQGFRPPGARERSQSPGPVRFGREADWRSRAWCSRSGQGSSRPIQRHTAREWIVAPISGRLYRQRSTKCAGSIHEEIGPPSRCCSPLFRDVYRAGVGHEA